MMRFATQGLVDPNRYPPGGGVIDEIPRRWDEESGTMVPINPPGGILENQSSNNDFINTRDRVDNYLTASSWITPLRKQWIDHTSGKNPITDPVYRKELQDIILYPNRVMGV